MDILFDHQSFARQATGGVSRSYVELARALNFEPEVSARILAPIHWNKYLCETENRGFASGAYQSRAIFRLWNQRWWFNHTFTNIRCRINPPDILHETWYSTHPYQLRAKTRMAITVHDMIYQVHPEWTNDAAERSRDLAASADRANIVFCDSEYTRNDLLNWRSSLDPKKIFVVHLVATKPGACEMRAGCPSALSSGQQPLAEAFRSPYFLYVGQRSSANKNFSFLVRAFAASGMQKDYSLVCFGGGGFNDSEKELFNSLGLPENRIHQVPHNDALLRLAYERAVALIYPSLYEGFGLPPLEAMGYDCPVLSANATCLPEIGGDAALYFSPTDVNELVYSLQQVAQNESVRNNLMMKGRSRFARFSGKAIADQALAAYKTVF